jgi:hypothetical protein
MIIFRHFICVRNCKRPTFDIETTDEPETKNVQHTHTHAYTAYTCASRIIDKYHNINTL